MRVTAMAAGFLIAGAVWQTADAGPYVWREQHRANTRGAWCLSNPDGGPYDCGYATLQQCLVSRQGVGGSCDPNPRYVDARTYPAKKRKARRYYR